MQYRIRPVMVSRDISSIHCGYDLKPLRYKWIAQLCWSILKRIKALEPHYEEDVRYYFDNYHAEKLGKYVVDQMIEARFRDHASRDDFAFLMGRQDFHELMEGEIDNLDRFNTIEPFPAGPIGYEAGIYHVPVHIVNNLSGFAIVPKVAIEKKV